MATSPARIVLEDGSELELSLRDIEKAIHSVGKRMVVRVYSCGRDLPQLAEIISRRAAEHERREREMAEREIKAIRTTSSKKILRSRI